MKNFLIFFGFLIGFVGGYVGINFLNSNTSQVNLENQDLNVVSFEKIETLKNKEETSNQNVNLPQPEDQTVRLAIVGDISFVGLTGEYMLESGATPFQFVWEEFDKYDLVIGNLETNISEPGIGSPQPGKNYTFNSPIESLDKMKGNLDVVSLANNHTNDYGSQALLRQIELLNENGIVSFGAGKDIDEAFEIKIVEVKGLRIGFMGVNSIEGYYQDVRSGRAGSAYFDENLIKSSIEKYKDRYDFLIVMPHWGVEHQEVANSWQRSWARKFVEWGADLIVGAHPHVVQDEEVIDGVPVYYSLGNFIFSGFGWNPKAIESFILGIEIKDGKIVNTSKTNVKLTYHGFPEII
ncbi:MAG: capsular polysaccharide biosynthesis protein [Candidatus Dojkabacteria bacterium]|nr:MAG: capsular polysaccharide biosynthesis protein [Candidatus Dojkabacteria bacterium]